MANNERKRIVIFWLLLIALFLVGCGTININQKIYRDWSFDISIEVNSDNQAFLNLVKDGFEDNPITEKATIVEQESGFKYVLEKATIEDISTEEGNSLFESIGIKKEFKFPFYYYTLSLKNKGSESEEFGSFGMSFNYMIEPFGKITDSNGVYVGEDKRVVKFNLLKTKDYYLTFRDFFLSSWIGGASKITDRVAKETAFSSAADIPDEEVSNEEAVLNEEAKTSLPEPSGKFYEKTTNEVTLRVTGYTFERRTESYGKLNEVEVTIYNQKDLSIYPSLQVIAVDKKDSAFTVQKTIDLELLGSGDYIQKKVNIDLAIPQSQNPKELKVAVTEWDTWLTSVGFNTNFLEGFK